MKEWIHRFYYVLLYAWYALYAVALLGIATVAPAYLETINMVLKYFIIGFLRSPSETSSTVNHLISIQQFLRITLVVNYIWFGVAYLMPFSLEDLLGGTFCTLFTAFEMFSFFGNIYWSSALAVTRLFYVKFNTFIR